MAEPLHEEGLSPQTKDVNRAIQSLIEEFEAVNWYNQRAEATQNQGLKDILIHNRDEEIEHACMALEWLRREIPKFDEELKTYLFTSGPITELEEAAAGEDAADAADTRSGDLGLKSLRKGDI